MIFKTLKERCYYFRDLPEQKVVPNSWFIIMLDGHSFSKKVKNKFKKPFDEIFINAMNETALHLCKHLQSVKFAFVQSDEISLFCKDDPERDIEFGGRFCKLLSLTAAMATAHFNRVISEATQNYDTEYEFDSKVWNVPDAEEAYAWLRFRSIDCIRNSINQYSETFMSHKERSGINRDDLKKLLKENGHDWDALPEGQKYGRVIVKELQDLAYAEKQRHKYVLKDNDATLSNWAKYVKDNF